MTCTFAGASPSNSMHAGSMDMPSSKRTHQSSSGRSLVRMVSFASKAARSSGVGSRSPRCSSRPATGRPPYCREWASSSSDEIRVAAEVAVQGHGEPPPLQAVLDIGVLPALSGADDLVVHPLDGDLVAVLVDDPDPRPREVSAPRRPIDEPEAFVRPEVEGPSRRGLADVQPIELRIARLVRSAISDGVVVRSHRPLPQSQADQHAGSPVPTRARPAGGTAMPVMTSRPSLRCSTRRGRTGGRGSPIRDRIARDASAPGGVLGGLRESAGEPIE